MLLLEFNFLIQHFPLQQTDKANKETPKSNSELNPTAKTQSYIKYNDNLSRKEFLCGSEVDVQ